MVYSLAPETQKRNGLFYTEDIEPARQVMAKNMKLVSSDVSNATEVTTKTVGGAVGTATGAVTGAVTGTAGAVAGAVTGTAGAVTRTVGSSVNAVTNTVSDTTHAVTHTAGHGVEAVLSVPHAAMSIIRPAAHVQAVTIEPQVLAAATAQASAAPTQPAHTAPVSAATAWPIRGAVTTEYGVKHWPFQARHTGMDISSGNRSGVVLIKPFKAGRVVAVVPSGGLGKHVVVDHGGGITSTYGHMYSISVSVGQAVDINSTLGREGSTGVSTGTHLHFEIRQNGELQNPRKFIPGNPY